MDKLQPNTYETFEQGSYDVTDIEWFSCDNSGDPIFKDQTWGDDLVLMARYRTQKRIEKAGEITWAEGPPGSIQPHELPLFVVAFGGDPTALPENLGTTEALLVAEREINTSTKVTSVYVGKKGWVSNIYDMCLPEGWYVFKYHSLRPKKDGKLYWRKSNWGTENAIVRLEVVGEYQNESLVPSLFGGTTQDVWFARTGFFVTDVLAPIYKEVHELEYIEAMAAEHVDSLWIIGKVATAEKKKSPSVDRSTLRAVNQKTLRKGEVSNKQNPGDRLKSFITENMESDVFNNGGGPTTSGKEWLKKNLAPACIKLGSPKIFRDMTDANVDALIKQLQSGLDNEEDW